MARPTRLVNRSGVSQMWESAEIVGAVISLSPVRPAGRAAICPDRLPLTAAKSRLPPWSKVCFPNRLFHIVSVNLLQEGMIMNREFEFTRLLRAYRKGIISEQTFEAEMALLEGANGGGFTAMGKTYACERDALVAYLQRVRNGEAAGAAALSNWAQVCQTDCMRSGLRTI